METYIELVIQSPNETNWENKGYVLSLIKKDGLLLEKASEELQNDKEVVLAAVSQCGLALKYVSDELSGDYAVVMAACRQNFDAYIYANQCCITDEMMEELRRYHNPQNNDEFDSYVAKIVEKETVSESDVAKLVDAIIKATETSVSSDAFWTNADTLLLNALLGAVYTWFPPFEKNLKSVIHMLKMMEIRTIDETFKNSIDLAFEYWEANNPEHFAVVRYKEFRQLKAVVRKSIKITCIDRMTKYSNLSLIIEPTPVWKNYN